MVYRKHAGSENKSTYVKFTHQKRYFTSFLLHFDSPYAFDGGLTLEKLTNRSQGEKGTLSLILERAFASLKLHGITKPPTKVEN